MQHLHSFAINYIGDFNIGSPPHLSEDIHQRSIQLFSQFGLHVAPEKCTQPTATVLGLLVDSQHCRKQNFPPNRQAHSASHEHMRCHQPSNSSTNSFSIASRKISCCIPSYANYKTVYNRSAPPRPLHKHSSPILNMIP